MTNFLYFFKKFKGIQKHNERNFGDHDFIFSWSALLQKHLEYHVYQVKSNMLPGQHVPLLPTLYAKEEEKWATSKASNIVATTAIPRHLLNFLSGINREAKQLW